MMEVEIAYHLSTNIFDDEVRAGLRQSDDILCQKPGRDRLDYQMDGL